MVRQQPKMAAAATTVVALLGLVEGVGLGLLLPLLSLIGIETGAKTGGPAQAVEQAFKALGIPLTLVSVLAVFFAVGLLQVALHGTQQYLIVRSGESLTSLLRRRLFDATSRANWSILSAGRGAHLVNAMVSEANRIGLIYGNTITAFGLLANFLIYLGLAFWLSWRFTLLMALFGGFSMLALRWLYRSSRRFGAYTSAATNRMQEVLDEHIGGASNAKLIRALGGGEWSRKTFSEAVAAVGAYMRRNQGNTILIKTSVEPLGLLFIVTTIYLSVTLVRLPAAELILFLLIFYRITPRLVMLQEMLQRISGVLPAYESISQTLQSLEEARERHGNRPFSGVREAIELKGVRVCRGERTLLETVNLTIRARTSIALFGTSGGGKTTILDVLTGVVQPDEGAVLVDGVPLEELDLTAYRSRLGIVPQENVFFHDTVAANLRLAKPDATDAEIWDALAAAHADGFVRARGEGLDTVIGDQGLRLSGGQRQRLALARALLRKPDLLLLDEPTSALDQETESVIRNTLKCLRGHTTIVVVTHRMSMTQDADHVYAVEAGKLTGGYVPEDPAKEPAGQPLAR